MAPSSSAHDQIRNTIASIALSFDTNNFPHLKNSFTPNASADYVGSLGLLVGLENIVSGLQKAIGHITTFHSLSTQVIDLTGENKAEATTYVSASYYSGGKSFFAKARYFDKLVRVIGGDDKGKWLIESRYVTMMGVPRGDVSIFGLELDEWVDSLKG